MLLLWLCPISGSIGHIHQKPLIGIAVWIILKSVLLIKDKDKDRITPKTFFSCVYKIMLPVIFSYISHIINKIRGITTA